MGKDWIEVRGKKMRFAEFKRSTMDSLIKSEVGEKCGMFDKEMGPILTAINAEPNVFSFQSCYGHDEGDPKYPDNAWQGSRGVIWLYFDGEIPSNCPFPNEILEDREIVPVLEVYLRRRCFEDWRKLLDWIRTKG